MRIDSHHHLWQYDPVEYDWIDEDMARLKQDFLISDLKETLVNNQIDGSVVVQARQSMEETLWLLSLANECSEIKGVVGWIDLKAADLESQLTSLKPYEKLVGFRHVLQGETDPNFMLDPAFIGGLKLLAQYGFTYDLLIYADQLPTALEMLKQVPDLPVVIDHIAKPNIKTGEGFYKWKLAMESLSKNPNIYCKVSGMVTEANWHNWRYQLFIPYLTTIFECFGNGRIMFGSDWPVCLVAGEYSEIKQIIDNYLSVKDEDTLAKIFGLNAVNFYQLK